MLLADMGADVVRIERLSEPGTDRGPIVRGRTIVQLDLKEPDAVASVLALAASADVLVEGFRPGVMERLGLGPDRLLGNRPGLVYARMTGWGQHGPRATTAGHDINYISLTGALDAIGSASQGPAVPLNLLGDYGGGALYLVSGILAALLRARSTGSGDVVDCAICDGVTSLMTLFHHLRDQGSWDGTRQANQLDGGAHFYATYECADGRHVAVGAIEPKFYAQLRSLAGWSDPEFDAQNDRQKWPELRQKAAALFKRRTRDEWVTLFSGSDCCVSPVLTLDESRGDPHLAARGSFVTLDGVVQPAPAPRFLRTPSKARPGPLHQSAAAVMRRWASGRDEPGDVACDGDDLRG